MMILHSIDAKAEQERIENDFKAGVLTCKRAFITFLHAIITFILSIIHIAISIINCTIGIFVIFHAVFCALRLLLVQLQELTENSMNTIERGER